MKNLLMSLFCSTIFLNGSSAAVVDARRLALESSSAEWFRWVTWYGYAVAVGCAMEAWEVCATIKDWYLLKFKQVDVEEDRKSWAIPLAAIGLLVIVSGIVLETYSEGKAADAETELRNHFSEKLSAAEDASARAMVDAENARKETGQLQKDTAGLRAKTEEAKRDMVAAQLELAKLTAPIRSVPIINGIAEPDPTKGLRLRILLHTDVRIKLPVLSKGKAVTWTLFIVQDDKGNHQFSTFPHNVMFGNFLQAAPHSFCNMEFVTDEHGTTDIMFGSASCPTNQSDPFKK